MKLREWVTFSLLGLVWGSSFLWIKVAVREIGPATLVGFRLLIGLIGLLAVVAVRRPALPSSRRTLAILAILGITNTALPFVLISWGEQFIDSAIASILNGTVPLFTIIIAHLFLHDDRITFSRIIGLVTGFLGVVVLMSRDVEAGTRAGSVLGQVAVLAAAVSYAGSSVFARRNLRQVDPVVQASFPLISADLMAWAAALATEAPLQIPSLPITWVALVWLGLLGSCLAYLLYFHLLHAVGPTRATMVTYVFPVVGVILGVVFLQERADWHLWGGVALVALGIGVVNWPRRTRVAATAAAK
jgi:drug/metabolite transporter (DMT)-like permease